MGLHCGSHCILTEKTYSIGYTLTHIMTALFCGTVDWFGGRAGEAGGDYDTLTITRFPSSMLVRPALSRLRLWLGFGVECWTDAEEKHCRKIHSLSLTKRML